MGSPQSSLPALRTAVITTAIGVAAGLVIHATGPASSASSPAPAGNARPVPAGTAVASCRSQPLGNRDGSAIAAAAGGQVVIAAVSPAGTALPVVWRAGKAEVIPTGLTGSVPAGVNAHGDVVGNSPAGENTIGWLWANHRIVRLRGHGALTALPAAISDNGVIVGALETSEGLPSEGGGIAGAPDTEQAAAWLSPGKAPVILTPLSGDQGAHAYAVDSAGRIGGVSEGARFRPVTWSLTGKPRELPGLGGGYGIVRAFGPGGVAVGDAVAGDGTDRPVLWTAAGRIADLGLPAGSRTAQATGVLASGVVVGTAQMPVAGGGTVPQAVRWPAPGQPQLLGGQGQGESTVVTDVASARTVVGYRIDARGDRHPVLWRCGS